MAWLGLICAAMLLAGPAVADVRFSGTVVAETPVELRAARDGLLVAELFVESGDRVEAGTLLARLRSDEQRAALQGAEAERARAEAEIAVARTDILMAESDLRIAANQARRSGALGISGAVSSSVAEQREEARLRAEAMLARSRAALAMAEANLSLAAANLDTARLHLADTEIRAPIDGLILSRSAEVGTLAASMFLIAGKGAMIVDALVLDPDFRQMKPEMPAMIRFADGREVSGHVDSVGGSIDPATRLGHVRIALEGDAVAGAFVSGEVLTPEIRASLP